MDRPVLSLPFQGYDSLRFLRSKKDYRRRWVSHKTALVVEGFPSSANSYLIRVLQKALQDRELRYADHQHSPAMVATAVRKEVPVILCVREPLQCCLSAARRWPLYGVKEYLERYIQFYSVLKPFVSGIQVVDFADITARPLEVLGFVFEKEGVGEGLLDLTVDPQSAERPEVDAEELQKRKEEERELGKKLKSDFLSGGDENEKILQQATEVYSFFHGLRILQNKASPVGEAAKNGTDKA